MSAGTTACVLGTIHPRASLLLFTLHYFHVLFVSSGPQATETVSRKRTQVGSYVNQL